MSKHSSFSDTFFLFVSVHFSLLVHQRENLTKNCRKTKLKFFLLGQEIRTRVSWLGFFFKALFWSALEANEERVIVLLVQLHIMSYGSNIFLQGHCL